MDCSYLGCGLRIGFATATDDKLDNLFEIRGTIRFRGRLTNRSLHEIDIAVGDLNQFID